MKGTSAATNYNAEITTINIPRDGAENLPQRQVSQRYRSSRSQRTNTEDPNAEESYIYLDKEKKEDNIIQTNPKDPKIRYLIGQKLSEGAFGIIYTGVKLFNRKQVVIKFVYFPAAQSKVKILTGMLKQELKRLKIPQLYNKYHIYQVLARCCTTFSSTI